VAGCRRAVAQLLGGVEPSRVVFTMNATAALNIAIGGLTLSAGDRVVTSCAEHNSVLRPLEKLRRERGVKVELIPVTPQGALDEEAFRKALLVPPRLVVLTHASNVTGAVFPVKRLFGLARATGAVTLLDASQTLGHIHIQPHGFGADMVAFTGHKGLLGPSGTGGLYVSPALELDQTVVGGTGVRSDLASHPPEMPMRLEAGTPNAAGLAGLAAAIEWLLSADPPPDQTAGLTSRLRQALSGIGGVRLFHEGQTGNATGVVSFLIRGWDAATAGEALQASFGIQCRTGLHCAPLIHSFIGSAPRGTIRFSLSRFTTEEEISLAVSAVQSLASCN
jgi:selenocysteine lyase/cysteine desulfurase